MKFHENPFLGSRSPCKFKEVSAKVEKKQERFVYDMNPIKCKDGTMILINVEEVNEHLKNGWSLIEAGALISKSVSPVHLIKFGFRLRSGDNPFSINAEWEDILTYNNDMYGFESRKSIIENIIEIRIATSNEIESLTNAGWIKLHECKFNVEEGFHKQYALGLPAAN